MKHIFTSFLLFFALNASLFSQATLPIDRKTWSSTPTGWSKAGTSTVSAGNTTCFGSTDNSALINTTGDYFQVFFNKSPNLLSFGLEAKSGTVLKPFNGIFDVSESADGASWTSVYSLNTELALATCSGGSSLQLKPETRYVRFVMTNEGTNTGTNLVLDNVSITALTLPIKLKTFDTKIVENTASVELNWQTETELENDFFAIERSNDGNLFSEIGRVKGAGTTLLTQFYTFLDENPFNGVNYYRLKQVDFDGSEHFSPVQAANINLSNRNENVKIKTTLAQNLIWIEGLAWDKRYEIELFDLSGKRILSEKSFGNSVTKIDVSNLSQNVYIIRIFDGIQAYTHKIVKM